ncbi:DUF397 domain-containing protein [Streptomyces sp. NPDC006739]|uniref:DUF397 domain-containing protein n=1 Tax=Streptomyces sp. NPDC006739 TaxID=3364763 RepID=UPI00367E22FC
MSELHWKKSTYSPDASNCLEIATAPTAIHIRDSKTPTGPRLTVTRSAWTGFLAYVESRHSGPALRTAPH